MSDNKINISKTSEYKNNYQKNNYDRIALQVDKGKKEELKTHCTKFSYKSLNDFINKAINEKIARDLGEM